jgi:NADH-quinone oxidoreductase subunit J
MSELTTRLLENWALLVPLLLGAAAIWLLLPRPQAGRRWAGGLIGLAALVWAGFAILEPSGTVAADMTFYLFAGAAVVGGALMITSRNPVHAALWFAVVTLSVCGLFLLQSAPFLAAATAIVYAGAIIVTFLFVIMLARQAAAGGYDYRAGQPLLATLTGFVLLGGLLFTLREWGGNAEARFLAAPTEIEANALSRAGEDGFGTVRGLGRSLFGDYLFAVELAGTLLLVAAIGAIAIAPRRSRGTL